MRREAHGSAPRGEPCVGRRRGPPNTETAEARGVVARSFHPLTAERTLPSKRRTRHSPHYSVLFGPVQVTIAYRCVNGIAENIAGSRPPQRLGHCRRGVATTEPAGRIDWSWLFTCPPATTAATRSQYSCRLAVTDSDSPLSLRCRILRFDDDTVLRQSTCHLAVAAETTKGATR